MLLDASLLNTLHYKVRIKDKVVLSREKSSSFSNTSVLWLLKGEPSGRPRLRLLTLLLYIFIYVFTFRGMHVLTQLLWHQQDVTQGQ